jgi:ubiquinone/menaquinone biosynthesis C-methylase UbiE
VRDKDLEEVRAFWNRVAADWQIQVGDEGDSNRRLNSDPVLWRFAGDVAGLKVLDAGCGTGYLTRQFDRRGALVTGVDLSEEMIAIARAAHPDLTFRVDSVSDLRTIGDEEFELAVSNYVLMDVPDLGGTVRSIYRVLQPGGCWITVFSHPCFPQGGREVTVTDDLVSYAWDFSYFEQRRRVDPPWNHFTSDFIWFHRPLSDYWKAFAAAGFAVVDFEEPRIDPARHHEIQSARRLRNAMTRPYSVAFKLEKPGRETR